MGTRLGSVIARARSELAGWIPSRRHPTAAPDSGALLYLDTSTGRVHAYRRGQSVDLEATGTGGSSAPVDARYLVTQTDATLTQERVLGLPYDHIAHDGGAGGTWQPYPMQDSWLLQSVATPSHMGIGYGRGDSAVYQVSAASMAVYAGSGRTLDVTSSSTSAWAGLHSPTLHCPMQGVIRWVSVLRTGSSIADLRVVHGLMTTLPATPADVPGSGDYIVIRLPSGGTQWVLTTRDGTAATSTTIADVTVTTSTVYALELLLDQTASTPIAQGRVWTYSGTSGTWTPGSWYSHTSRLPRTAVTAGDVMAHNVTASSTSRVVGIARCRGWSGVSAS